MTKEDYREKVEEHRQEIDLHNESGAKMSRTSRQRKKSAKKQSNPIMTILTIVLIFIPLSILGYVWFFYEPSTSASENVNVEEKDDIVLEIVKQDPKAPESPKATTDDEQEETNKEDKASANTDAAANEAEKQRLAAEKAKKAEEKRAKEEAAEAKKAEEAQKIAATKAKEQEAKKKAEEAAKAQQKTHTVQSTDNLYRIALKYYGDGSPAYIEKIKAANNLSSDSISAGQVLIITP